MKVLFNACRNWFIEVKKTLSALLDTVSKQLEISIRQTQLLEEIKKITCDHYWIEHYINNPHYSDRKKLQIFGYQVYSQNDEHGIIAEILRRIGHNSKFFVEIGVEDGVESNTSFLLSKGWSGVWVEQSYERVQSAKSIFSKHIENGMLKVVNDHVTAENIEHLLSYCGCPRNIDLLSIDIDGNDYHVWESIKSFSPRLVVVEYNAMFPPTDCFVMRYDSQHVWAGDSNFGASLKAFELLAREKGYSLVGCNFYGVNAFFVREDLVEDHFFEPFDAVTHYEPPRYFLVRNTGHPKCPGNFDFQ